MYLEYSGHLHSGHSDIFSKYTYHILDIGLMLWPFGYSEHKGLSKGGNVNGLNIKLLLKYMYIVIILDLHLHIDIKTEIHVMLG